MNKEMYFIDFTGLKLGKHTFNFEITNDLFSETHYEDLKIIKSDVQSVFEKKESMMELSSQFYFEFELVCDKCGEPYKQEVQFKEDMIFKFGNESDSTDEIINISQNDNKLLLDSLFYEWTIINLPMQRKHPLNDDGEFTCSEERLNRLDEILESQEKKKEDQIDERWSDLKKLLNK